MPSELFRKEALARVSSPEQLDQLMRIAPSAGSLALMAIAGLIACALLWGFFGSLPTKVNGEGILLSSSGMLTVTSQSSGEVTNLYIVKGGRVKLGQPLARIAQPLLKDKVDITQSTLSRLREKYRQAKEFGTEDTRLNLETFEIKKQHLKKDIDNLRGQNAWYSERVKAMEPYVADGVISQLQQFQYKSELVTIQEHLSQKENELKGLEAQILEQKNKLRQLLLDLEHQIASAEEDLRTAVDNLNTHSLVLSPYSGRVIEVGTNIGSIAAQGTPLATLEVDGSDVAYLEAVLYFTPDQGQRVKAGMVVQISPDTAKQERYGSALGLVTSVSSFPSSQAEMDRTLQNPELVRQHSNKGVKIEARCALVPDHTTASGYKWSSSSGPDFIIEPGTLCSASVIIERQRPIALIVPLFNKYVLGRGAEKDADEKS